MLHFNLANYIYSINSILWVKLFEGSTGEGTSMEFLAYRILTHLKFNVLTVIYC